ncbi:MAG: NUDIX hydrolase [Acholeplasmatales bacterium]|jgi:ADP-ribose pyrophosphatase|nr:NUDIX hydrolase [Acholeplasmatales bacterium]
MKKKNLEIIKQTQNSHLNMYLVKDKDMEKYYQFASRKPKIEDLALNFKNIKSDAVRILPWFIKDNEIYVVLIEEYRIAVDKYLLGLPAGLIEENEDVSFSAKRELEEETGYIIKRVIKKDGPFFTSPGLSDESIITVEAEVEVTPVSQHLDPSERINVRVIKYNEILDIINSSPNIGYQSKLLLEAFYYKNINKKPENF